MADERAKGVTNYEVKKKVNYRHSARFNQWRQKVYTWYDMFYNVSKQTPK